MRFLEQYGIPEYDANLLSASKAMADYFEAAAAQKQLAGDAGNKFAKAISNWDSGRPEPVMNLENRDISEVKVTPAHLVELVDLVDNGSVSVTMAKTVLEDPFPAANHRVKSLKLKVIPRSANRRS